MKVCKKRCWMTEDRKLLLDDGNSEEAAFLAAISGQEVSDAYAKNFDNGSDFFEDVKRYEEPSHNIAFSGHEDIRPGSTNVGKKGEEPESSTGAAVPLDDSKGGFTNIGTESAGPKEKVTVKSSKGKKE
jgi:hypothetical protein